MAASVEAAVCNVALLRVGQLQGIASLDDSLPQARACKALWNDARDAVLQARRWSFARRRADLAQLTAGERGAWSYAYTLPSDYIAARYIETGATNPGEGDDIPFEIEGDSTVGRVLLCNEDTVELVYTAQVTAMGLWDPMARDALAMKLAADLALSLAKNRALAVQLMQWWVGFANAAAAANYNARRSDVAPDSALITSRY